MLKLIFILLLILFSVIVLRDFLDNYLAMSKFSGIPRDNIFYEIYLLLLILGLMLWGLNI